MSVTSPSPLLPGGKVDPPGILAAWPRSSQLALAGLILLALGLITAHILIAGLSDARPTTLAAEQAITQPLNLNTADRSQLRQLPDVGDKLASAILEYRQIRGGFASVDELLNVSGFGRTRVERLRPWLFVEGEEVSLGEGTAGPVPITVKKPAGTPTRPRKGEAIQGVLDLNSASEDELRNIEGLGPVLARRIVEARQRTPFRSVEDLLRVPYLKQKTLDKVRPFVTVKLPTNQEQ